MNIEEELSTQIFGATIEFGIGIINNLAEYIGRFNIGRLLVVTDRGIIEAGIANRIFAQLDADGVKYSVFDNVQSNPTDENVMDGLDAYRRSGCDALLGVGGGSPIDVAKAIRVSATHPGHISEYYFPVRITGEMPPLIAIPTTSGTGTEVSTGSVITDTRYNRKRVIRSGAPSLALVDPELTLSLPPSMTAATGMDALSHSIEAYVAKRYNPLAGAIALSGIRLIANNLRRAVEDGSDMTARKNMAMAGTMGGLAFSGKGLGVAHSLAHQLSTSAGVHHGVANALMLPKAMEFNLEFAIQEYADIALALGIDTFHMSIAESARSSISAVRQLSKDIGLPDRLRDVGVEKESIPIMAEMALSDHCHTLNPRSCTKEDMITLYESAF